MNRLSTSWGAFTLTRFPEDPRDQLRAWDASDEYLLGHLAETGTDLSGTVAVLGDRWGALVTALQAAGPRELVQITDSYLGGQATRANLARAGAAPDAVRLLTTQDPPPSASTCSSSASPRASRSWRTSCTGSHPPCTRTP